MVARLRARARSVLGKTNVPIFAADWQSFNAVYGQTNNPWDVARTPGGSTGGGAAALAAGLSYLEPGSDLAGSIRIPAHFCGVYGHKPTLDVVPMRGHIPPPPGISATPPSTLPVAGPLARSAADLLAALEVLGGPDGDDARAWRWSLPPARGARLARLPHRLRARRSARAGLVRGGARAGGGGRGAAQGGGPARGRLAAGRERGRSSTTPI